MTDAGEAEEPAPAKKYQVTSVPARGAEAVPPVRHDTGRRGSRRRSGGGAGAHPLESEFSWFVLASVLDAAITYIGLYRGVFRESNPVAAYFLNHWGPRGLIGFKAVTVALVCGIAWYIHTRRPDTARLLLRAATLIVGGVVVYSVALLVRHG